MQDANIIILDYKEDLVRWLDPDLADVEETTQKNACRKIKITYPYENEHIDEYTKLWYQQGNKIYIPPVNGITSCLYVINTQYEIDFWEKNTITVEAEEVLTELNYDMISFPSETVINVTEEKLDEWFGAFYDISGMDPLPSNRKQITPEGIMSRMSLLRMIEEETGRVFTTTYEDEDNFISRTLFLADADQLRFVADTETLDLNYNLESLEFTKSEEDTYNAMCPVFTNSSNVVTTEEITANPSMNISTAIVNKAEQRTENNNNIHISQTLESLKEQLSDAGVVDGDLPVVANTVNGDDLLQQWLDYEVEEGEEIPMIIQQDEEGNTVTTQTWAAPFEKAAGELYIKYIGTNQTDYTSINPYNPAKAPTLMKCGKENTSETLCEAIYNELANSLLNKLYPEYELKIKVKDIQDMLGYESLGYYVHESLQVRVPNFNYYVPCRITETVKNLHYPGENTIKIETEVTSIFDMIPTDIHSEDRLVGTNETNTVFGGTLTTQDGEPLPDRYVVMDIKLTKAYTEGTTIVKEQELKEFDPIHNTYLISDAQIQNLEKQLRNALIKKELYDDTFYRIRDVEGVAYSISFDYAVPLVHTRNDIYIINEEYYGGTNALGHGFFDDTVEVHIYDNPDQLIRSSTSFQQMKKYYYSRVYELHHVYDPILGEYWGFASSCERQNGPTCLPASMSNATARVYAYRTEYELAQLMQTTEAGTRRDKAEQVMEQLGFKVDRYEATQANVEKYLKTPNSFLSLSVNVLKLGEGYYKGYYDISNDEEGNHAVLCTYWINDGNHLWLHVVDSNIPVYHPAFNGDFTPDDCWIKWEDVRKGIVATYMNGVWYDKGANDAPWMTVLTITDKLMGDVDESMNVSITNTMFDPSLYSYKFDLGVVRKAIMEVMDFIRTSQLDVDIMSSSSSVETSSNVPLDNVSVWWLRAIALAGMYYYQNNVEKTSKRIIEVSKSSDSMKYYSRFDRQVGVIGQYDWFTPCRVTDIAYMTGYICSTILFNLGIPYSPFDFVSGDAYVSLDKIGRTVVEKAGSINNFPALHYWLIDVADVGDYVRVARRDRDSFQDTVFLTWANSSSVDATATVKSSRYPLLLLNSWIDSSAKITYQNILGTGNSPNNRYDVTGSGAGDYNPFGVTDIGTIVGWHESVSEQLQGGDKGKALVVSWFSRTDFEEG